MSELYTIFVEKKKCVTPVFRGGYVNFFEAKQLPNSDKTAWGMQCMFPKDGPGVADWLKQLNQVYLQVLIDKFGKPKAIEVGKAIKANKRFPVRDGDDPANAGLSNADQLAGHWFINANNQFRQPFCLGPAGKAIDPSKLSTDDIYSGAWYRAMLEFWHYDTAGNQGISTSLAAFMKVKDDANLGAGTTTTEAESAFGTFQSEAVSMFDNPDAFDYPDDAGGGDAKGDTDDFDFI